MLLVAIIAARKKASLTGNRKKLLIARGLFGTGAMMLFFYALTKIPVANALLLNQTTPIFVLPLAAVFLKEKITGTHVIFAAIALVGITLVISPGAGMINLASIPALISAAFSASAYILVSKLKKTENTQVIVFWFMCISVLGSLPFVATNFVMPKHESLIMLIGVGIAGTIGQLLLTKAYSIGEAGRLSVLGSMGAIFGVGWDFWIWDHTPRLVTIIGGIIVIFACSALQIKQTSVKK